MKHKLRITIGAMAVFMAQNAFAQTQPVDRNSFYGSDLALDAVNAYLETLPGRAPDGIDLDGYHPLGSMVGQRQMEGRVLDGDPSCGWASTGSNPGCQEIAPMSMQMTSDICNDTEAAGKAESLLWAKDGYVLLTDNAAHQQYSTDSCAASVESTDNSENAFTDTGDGHLRDTGTLASSGYTLGAGFSAGDEWQDPMRLLLTGCEASDGDCATVDRSARCESAARAELLGDWGSLLDGSLCADTCDGVTHIYRQADAADISSQFLSRVDVADNGFPTRSTALNGGGFPAAVGAAPEDYPYCDGGVDEQYMASTNGSDPVRKPCDDDADLCGADGMSGVVQAIRSPSRLPSVVEEFVEFTFPTQQCARSQFARVPWRAAAAAICPDGTVPTASGCKLPYRMVEGEKDFNCINDKVSRPASLSGIDGRVYNSVLRTSDGTVAFLDGNDSSGRTYPIAASFRQNMVEIDTGFVITGKNYDSDDTVCQDAGASNLISCLTANNTCSLGLTSRRVAILADYTAENEPLVLGGELPSDSAIRAGDYPLSVDLYLAAIGGFEDMAADCEERGHDSLVGAGDYCFAEFEVAVALWAMNEGVEAAVSDLRYVSIPDDFPGRCVGSMESAGCGAPVVQSIGACEPERSDNFPSPGGI